MEVSSHGTLAFSGRVDLRAGTTGTLLLDPTDIRICAAGGGCTTDVTFQGGESWSINSVVVGQQNPHANPFIRRWAGLLTHSEKVL